MLRYDLLVSQSRSLNEVALEWRKEIYETQIVCCVKQVRMGSMICIGGGHGEILSC